MIYTFGFTANNVSSKILYKLKSIDCCYLIWSNNIEHYLQMLLHDQPQFILSMGAYSGKDSEAIRIETAVNNKFRNIPIDTGKPQAISLFPFLQPLAGMKLASGLGNSWCNLVSWKIIKLINQKSLKSQYTFLHIPNTFPVYKAVTIIEDSLKNLIKNQTSGV